MNVDERHLSKVKDTIRKHFPKIKVWAFGSRVSGEAKSYSDLDLVLLSQSKIDRSKLNKLQDEFEFSDLPFRVEILDWCRISDKFKAIIKEGYEEIL